MTIITRHGLTINKFTCDVKENGFKYGYFSEDEDYIKFFRRLDKTFKFYILNFQNSKTIEGYLSKIKLSHWHKHYFLSCFLDYIENETDHTSYNSEGYDAYREVEILFYKIEIHLDKENFDFDDHTTDFDKRVKRHIKILPTLEQQLYKLHEFINEFQKLLPGQEYATLISKCKEEVKFIEFQIDQLNGFRSSNIKEIDSVVDTPKIKIVTDVKYTISDIYINPEHSSLFFRVLQNMKESIIDDKNNYIYNGSKGIIKVIYRTFVTIQPIFKNRLPKKTLIRYFNDTLVGINLTANGSELSKFYSRLNYNELETEMLTLFSIYSSEESKRK